MMFYNNNQEPVKLIGLDPNNESELEIPPSLTTLLNSDAKAIIADSTEQVMTGILSLPESPIIFVSRPITQSDGTGPVRGRLVFAVYIDSAINAQLCTVTHLAQHQFTMTSDSLPPDVKKALKTITTESPVCIIPLDKKVIAGYTVIKDYFAKPVIALRVDIPREIFHQGELTLNEIRNRGHVIMISLVVSIIATGVLLGLIMLLALEKSVLKRVHLLSTQATAIGSSNDFSKRVEAAGKDEISTLGSSINVMLGALNETHNQIARRNDEMQLLMNTVPSALVSINENMLINPEYSKSAETILGKADLANEKFTEVLGLGPSDNENGKKLNDFFDVLKMGILSDRELFALNPFETVSLKFDNCTRWLNTRFFLMKSSVGSTGSVLAVIEDITEEKKLEEQVERSQRENLQLKAIAENPDLFREFLNETKSIILSVKILASKLTLSPESKMTTNELFRGVHTIKGTAGSFGFSAIADIAGELEERLSPLRDNFNISQELIDETRAAVIKLEETFMEAMESSRKFLGEDVDKEDGIFLRVPLEELKTLKDAVHHLPIEESLKNSLIFQVKNDIIQRIRYLQAIPAKKGLARAIRIIPGLVERLNKKVEFEFTGQELMLDCEIAYELNTPLVHLFRNAIDHGIETPDERTALGKPPAGKVKLNIVHNGISLVVEISDDGKGISDDRLRKTAVRQKRLTESEAEKLTRDQCLELIFLPGFTTAEQVTDISGRGVGMDSVVDIVKDQLGGSISIESEVGKGTLFRLEIPVA
jgi:two-component system chemotaxis sensor kinase CheA